MRAVERLVMMEKSSGRVRVLRRRMIVESERTVRVMMVVLYCIQVGVFGSLVVSRDEDV